VEEKAAEQFPLFALAVSATSARISTGGPALVWLMCR